MSWGSSAVIRVRNWSLQTTLDTLETTDLGSGLREYVPGLKSATGSASIFYHDDDTSLQSVLDDCISNDVPIPTRLSLVWGPKRIEFDAYVNNASITCSVGEVMSADVSFTMTGQYQEITL